MTGRKRKVDEAGAPALATVSDGGGLGLVRVDAAADERVGAPGFAPYQPLPVPPGPIERQVRADIAKLGDLDGARASYAEVAYRLARALDVDDTEGATGLAGAARELRAALDEIWRGVKHARSSDSVVSGLGSAVGGVDPHVSAPVRNDP